LLFAGLLNLSPQEAYYWFWSLHLELSYFDHPPMVAYSIKAFTVFLGNTVYAVRLPAIFDGMGTTLVVYSLADKFFGTRAGLLTALLLNCILPSSANIMTAREVKGFVIEATRKIESRLIGMVFSRS
jgi:4-amino-4-deoxy-L-arabinose transferase-like glycosyltransferase